jgi:hypothetical protein
MWGTVTRYIVRGCKSRLVAVTWEYFYPSKTGGWAGHVIMSIKPFHHFSLLSIRQPVSFVARVLYKMLD